MQPQYQPLPDKYPSYNGGAAAAFNDQHIPVLQTPPAGAQLFTPTYEYYVDINGQTCKVMKNPQPPSRTRTEYRCSPQSGRVYSVQVPVQSSPTPPTPVQPAKQYEWRCDSQTGRTYQVELPAIQQPSVGQLLPPHHPPWSNLRSRHGQLGATSHQQQQCLGTDDFNQQLQKQMTGIVKLCESGGGVTKKAMKILDFAKKGSTKWAKKATIDSINLPLFTLGAVSELESSLSGRTEQLSEGEFLAKLRHIKNYLDVCCLNSESSDFKGYGWSIAKDYALKVEEEVEQKLTTWEEMSGGVQTNQLVLAQMDCPKPQATKPALKVASGNKEKEALPAAKPKCPTYNGCKTDDKCEYEVSNPDKKCLFKHECTWCKKHLRQSWNHKEWSCKKKN